MSRIVLVYNYHLGIITSKLPFPRCLHLDHKLFDHPSHIRCRVWFSKATASTGQIHSTPQHTSLGLASGASHGDNEMVSLCSRCDQERGSPGCTTHLIYQE